jgi:thymidylate synthase
MALPPCHMMIQFYVNGDRLSACMYQRSADIFLGVPFNIASYALLVQIIAKICDLKAERLVMNFGDVHIYENHRNAVQTQLSREPFMFPRVEINNVSDIDQISLEQIELSDYQCHGPIKAAMAI